MYSYVNILFMLIHVYAYICLHRQFSANHSSFWKGVNMCHHVLKTLHSTYTVYMCYRLNVSSQYSYAET